MIALSSEDVPSFFQIAEELISRWPDLSVEEDWHEEDGEEETESEDDSEVESVFFTVDGERAFVALMPGAHPLVRLGRSLRNQHPLGRSQRGDEISSRASRGFNHERPFPDRRERSSDTGDGGDDSRVLECDRNLLWKLHAGDGAVDVYRFR